MSYTKNGCVYECVIHLANRSIVSVVFIHTHSPTKILVDANSSTHIHIKICNSLIMASILLGLLVHVVCVYSIVLGFEKGIWSATLYMNNSKKKSKRKRRTTYVWDEQPSLWASRVKELKAQKQLNWSVGFQTKPFAGRVISFFSSSESSFMNINKLFLTKGTVTALATACRIATECVSSKVRSFALNTSPFIYANA